MKQQDYLELESIISNIWGYQRFLEFFTESSFNLEESILFLLFICELMITVRCILCLFSDGFKHNLANAEVGVVIIAFQTMYIFPSRYLKVICLPISSSVLLVIENFLPLTT